VKNRAIWLVQQKIAENLRGMQLPHHAGDTASGCNQNHFIFGITLPLQNLKLQAFILTQQNGSSTHTHVYIFVLDTKIWKVLSMADFINQKQESGCLLQKSVLILFV
jgi:hypothetical protein